MGSTGSVDPHRRRCHSASAVVPFCGLLLLSTPPRAAAQLERLPEQGGRIASLGQPPRIHWHAGFAAGFAVHERTTGDLGVQLYLGAVHPLLNPVAGLGNIGVEAYVGARADALDGGARAILRMPYILTGIGLDYNARERAAAPLLDIYGPVRRGGIFVPGGLIRADIYPGRRSVTLGVSIPVGDRFAGRGRPLREHVVVARFRDVGARRHPERPDLEAVFDSLSASAEWIRRLVVPFLDQDGRTGRIALERTRAYVQALRDRLAIRGSEEQEVRHFHRQLEQAFSLAAQADSTTGQELARRARQTVLEEMLLPYNRLLGRKKQHDTLEDLAVAARGGFSKWLALSGGVPAERTDPVLYVFRRYTELIEEVRRTAAREWNDNRLVWLPLQLALLPEEHDEQSELDSLLARATARPPTAGNRVRYIANLQFHYELLRTIREATRYHVLWIHDFPAVSPDGRLDRAAFAQIVDGYLRTLAERVEAYDTTGTLPSYFIFLDQYYYEARRSRSLMTILEDPLHASPRLPPGAPDDRVRLERALARLRTAVRASRVLQAEAQQYGEAWLRNRVKVHVSITNREDPAFFSGALIGTVFGYPDNVMRDHRKIVFRDVVEGSPGSGEAIITGMGVGEQYLDPAWDDRALMVQGPMLLELRRAAAELLISQGLTEGELPPDLRLAPGPAAPLRTPDTGDEDLAQSALLLVNGTGYLPKLVNVAKALLYSLMPPGSVIKVPDSLWNSDFFGGLLVGAALRGVSVSIVAPARANAPSAGALQMARAHELLSRLLVARSELDPAIERAGGELRVGLYALEPDERGFASRAAEWTRRVATLPPTRALAPADSGVVTAVAAAAAAPAPAPTKAAPSAPPPAPKLHFKVQYLATGDVWSSLIGRPEWSALMSAYLTYRQTTYGVSAAGEDTSAASLATGLTRIARRLYGQRNGGLRGASYALVGSQNMDYRGMLMDGEVGLLFSGAESLVPLVDLLFLEGTVTWVDDQQALDRLLHAPTELQRRLGRLTKDAM